MDENPLVWVCSHPRSGTNLLMAALYHNFYEGRDLAIPKVVTGHWSAPAVVPEYRLRTGALVRHNPYGGLFGTHALDPDPFLAAREARGERPLIYIYRDGRAVVASMYRWHRGFLPSSEHGISFSDFLCRPLDWEGGPDQRVEPRLTPAEHWMAHLENWKKIRWLHMIRYEELVANPSEVLTAFAQWYGLTLPVDGVREIPERVGWAVDTNAIGWREIFSASDLEYYASIVPEDFWGAPDADE